MLELKQKTKTGKRKRVWYSVSLCFTMQKTLTTAKGIILAFNNIQKYNLNIEGNLKCVLKLTFGDLQ